MSDPTKKDVERYARRIHRCPEGYEGPCWGPTEEDRHTAKQRLTAVIGCSSPANHAPGGPFRYCPCGWTEEWGTFQPVDFEPIDEF
jgi:hypothetical protein